jgi:hypothetical protein
MLAGTDWPPVTDVSAQPIAPIFKVLLELLTLEDWTDVFPKRR